MENDITRDTVTAGAQRMRRYRRRREAVRRGFIEMVSKPSLGHPALYRFGPAIRRGKRSKSEGVG